MLKDENNLTNSNTNSNTNNNDSSLILFSDYGYIQVDKEEYNNKELLLVRISKISKIDKIDKNDKKCKKSTLTGTINKTNLKNELKVNLKTLYGERRMYNYTVGINDKISNLIDLLI